MLHGSRAYADDERASRGGERLISRHFSSKLFDGTSPQFSASIKDFRSKPKAAGKVYETSCKEARKKLVRGWKDVGNTIERRWKGGGKEVEKEVKGDGKEVERRW